MAHSTIYNQVWNQVGELVDILPIPYLNSGAPTSAISGPIGQIVLDRNNSNAPWMCIKNVQSNEWIQLAQANGIGSFTSLTVTPSASISLVVDTAGFNLQISGGNAVSIATTAGQSAVVNIGTGGTRTVSIGSPDASSTTNIRGGTGGVNLVSGGRLSVVPNEVTSATTTVVSNFALTAATYTGLTTAAGASQVLIVENSLVTAASRIFVTAANLGADDAKMMVTRVLPSTGQIDITLLNEGTDPLDGLSDVHLDIWVYA